MSKREESRNHSHDCKHSAQNGQEHGQNHCGCGHCHCDHAPEESSEKLWVAVVCGGLWVLGMALQGLASQVWLRAVYFAGIYLVLGWTVLKTAGKNLCRGQVLDEYFLMSAATLGAFVIGDFPEAVGVMLFFRVGELFEDRAVARSRRQILLAVDMRPETVHLADGRVIPAAQARVGDVLLVRPGDRIPLDGRILDGESRLDTAPITGEPVPVRVKNGDRVMSGCINLTGQLTLEAERALEQSTVSRILHSVENAAAGKPKISRFISRFSRVYTPAVVGLAVTVAVIPSVITGQWRYWTYTALSFLVMSCPCALVLSVPLAFFSGIGAGSKQGILFKDGAAVEALAGVRAVAMDKTGTLTQGVFALQEVEGHGETLRLCAALEQASNHPIAQSILAGAARLELPRPEQVEEQAGLGICGRVEDKAVVCGNAAWLHRNGITLPERKTDGRTWVYVAVDGEYAGAVCIADAVKPGARQAVRQLRAMGVTTAILTGDGTEAAEAVGRELGADRVCARLLPEEKLAALQQLRKEWGPVMFVGDGINDAPVLTGADVGIAMGTGADAAVEAADAVILTGQPQGICQALKLARQTRAVAWQNVCFALATKAAVMLLGLLGHASMWAAVFADTGTAVLCILNSVRSAYRK